MARALWRGSISFGLVAVPVRLYAAVRRQDVRFREVDRVTGQRVRHQRVRPLPVLAQESIPQRLDGSAAERGMAAQDSLEAEPDGGGWIRGTGTSHVSRSEVVRGYEITPGRFVHVTDEDLQALSPERSRSMDVEQFVSRKDLDPLYFESSYYVVPDQDRVRPFALLLRAMQETNRAAIGWLVLRSKRHLAALQPRGNLMLLTTLLFPDEIIASYGLEPPLPSDLTQREKSRAGLRETVEEPVLPPAASGMEDLMAALTASVEQARARRALTEKTERAPARRQQQG